MNTDVKRVISASIAVALLGSGLAFAASIPVAGVASAASTNGKIAFTSNRDGNNEIYVMDADGSNEIRLTNNAASDSQPAWSPDGTKIAFTSDRGGNRDIFVMETDGSEAPSAAPVNLTNNAGDDRFPAWSPDATRIAFTSDRGAASNLRSVYVMNADGTSPTNLTNAINGSDFAPAWSPDGTKIAYGINHHLIGTTFSSALHVMDPTGADQTFVTRSGGDTHPSWSPDGSRIVFSGIESFNDEILVVNSDGTGVVNLTNFGGYDDQPVWSPDGSQVVFTSTRTTSKDIFVMGADGSTSTALTDSGGEDSEPDWQPIPTFPPDAPLNVSVTTTATGVFVRWDPPASDGGSPITGYEVMCVEGDLVLQPVAVAADARSAAVDGVQGIVDCAVLAVNANGGGASSPSVRNRAPVNNGKIAFTSNRDGNDEIYVMDADGSNQTRLTNNLAVDSDPAWSADGNQIAFSSTRDGNSEIYVMGADGSNPVRITNNTALDAEPTWSPDGTRIAFSRGNFQLFIMGADGSNEINLTSLLTPDNPWFSSDSQPVWSPDGTKIAFLKILPNNNPVVYAVNINGTGLRNLTPDPNPESYESGPAWSPDGSKIAFAQATRSVDSSSEIYVMGADGSAPTRVHTHIAHDVEPTWSPDGTKIAFTTDRNGPKEIYAMGANGSALVNLTNAAGDDTEASWQAEPVTAPGMPLNVRARATTAGAVVSWDAPASDGGSPITAYTVACTEGDFTQELTVAGDARSATLNGFGVTSFVRCTVRATNAAGSGADPMATIALRPHSNGPIGFTSNVGGQEDLYEIASVSAIPTPLIPGFESESSDLAYSSDSSGRIAFSSSACGGLLQICIADGDGANVRQRSTTTVDVDPTWSPDGSQLAYMSTKYGDSALFLANSSGSMAETPLVRIDGVENMQPAWSPDGTRIAFVSDRFGGQLDLFMMGASDTAGTAPVRLTNDASNESEPTWSPDGTEIAFTTDRHGTRDVYVMQLTQGTIPERLTFDVANDYQPDWSPDGTRIAFTSDRDNNDPGIYVMGADGSAPTILINHPGFVEERADWSFDRGAPGAPLNVQAQRAADGVLVTWDPPSSDGGSPVTGYGVTCRQAAVTRQATTASNVRSANLAGFSALEEITCTVHAANSRGDGPESAVATVDVPPANRPPTAVLDLVDITNGTPGTPVYTSDDSSLNVPFELTAADAVLGFALTRSTDPDNNITLYEVKLTGPIGEPGSGVTTAFTSTGMLALPGIVGRETHWTIEAKITDANGAISTLSTSATLLPIQSQPGNRPPIALFAEVRADANSNGLINLDPGLSYDADPDDKIVSWQVDLIDLDEKVTLVDRGEGTPPRAVPMLLPRDQRSGFLYARLTVTDTFGATSETVEIIRFNQCSSVVFRQELPKPVLNARQAALDALASGSAGPAALLGVTLKQRSGTVLPAGVLVGPAPLIVEFTDQSFHRSGGQLVEHQLIDLSGHPELYGASDGVGLDRTSAGPITETIELENPLGFPIPVTFGLIVTDSSGRQSVQVVTIVVQPTFNPVLDMTIAQSGSDPMAMNVTPSVRGVAGRHPWGLSTLGAGAADVVHVFGDDVDLKTDTIKIQRGPGVAIRATFRFQYGGQDLGGGLFEQSVCRDVNLPVLTQSQANKPPTLSVTPVVQHTTGVARLHIVATDPDPAALGTVAAANAGFDPSDVVGMLEVTVGGQPARELGAVYIPGSNTFDVEVELPAAPPGRRDVVVEANDFFGGRTTATATIYDEPRSQLVDFATLTLTHAPAQLVRGSNVTETVSLLPPALIPGTTIPFPPIPALLVVDLPPDMTFVGATTEALGQASPVNAITAASQPLPGRWSCSQYVDAVRTRLLCSNSLLMPAIAPRLFVTYTSTSPKPQLLVGAGAIQPYAPLTLDQHLASLRDITSTESLRLHASDTIPLRGFVADAGPDQTVDAVTIAPDSTRAPTVVTLDGSGTSNDGRPQTYSWRQTGGPLVSWTSTTEGTGAALRAIGQQATFNAPPVTASSNLRFQLSVSVPATDTLPAQTRTDAVVITVIPPPNQVPAVTGLTSTPDATNSTPASGAAVAMVATATDPDGDPITFTWRAWRGTTGAPAAGTLINTTAGPRNNQRNLVWPTSTPQLTVEVTARDGRGGVTPRLFVLGAPLAPIQLSIGGTVGGSLISSSVPGATAGAAVALTASTNRAPSGGITWTLVSGPAIPGVTFPRTGTSLSFAAPTVTSAGQELVVRATATDTTGNVTATQTIALAAVPPPSVSLVVWPGTGAPPGPGSGLLDFLQPVLIPLGGLTLSASATATGTGALTYQWSASPTIPFSSPNAANTTMTAPNVDTFVTVRVRVTDATGASAEASRLVQVGSGLPTIDPADLTCAGGSVMDGLIRQARDNANRVGGLLDVTVPLGLPPIGTVNLGKLTFTGDCTTNPNIAFSGASITMFNGFLGGTGLTGSVTPDRICFNGGLVTLPPDLGLGSTAAGTAASPLCVSINPDDWLRPDPLLPAPAPPNPSDPPRNAPGTTPPDENQFRLPTITCPGGIMPITGSINWPGVFPGISLGDVVPKRTTVRFDCGFIEVTSTASAPWGDLALRGLARRDGSFEAAVVTKGMRLFGKNTNTDLTGTMRRSATGTITWLVGADISSPTLGTPAITLPTLHIELGTAGLSVSATGQLHFGSGAPAVNVTLAGTLTGQDEFTATLTGALASPWEPLPGLDIGSGSITASVARAAGVTTFDVGLAVAGDWQPFGPQLSVRQLNARLSNRPAPPDCAIAAGSTWTELTGMARVDIGAPAPVIDLTARACIGISQPSVLISSTANLNSWKPVRSVDFTLNSVGLTARKPANGDWTVDLTGTANYAGIQLAGRARLSMPSGSFVLDAAGDLSGLHLGPVNSGHIVFTNNPVNGYVPVPLPGDPPSGAAPINLITGLTAFADINLDANTRTQLDKVLNPPAPQPKVLPIPEAIRFTAQLGGASLRLEASIAFPPGQGLTLVSMCPDEAPKAGGKCLPDHKLTTSLRLTSFFLSIDTTGRFGFGGDAVLQLPSSDGIAPASTLLVRAQASIDLTAPSIDVSLSFTGDWVNALGMTGLTLRDLGIQVGVNFASPIPIPTVGIGATVARLPDDIAKMLGIQNDQPEPMRFVVLISPTKPIFELTLGVADGHMFLKPVQPISDAHKDALTIDYASLVFAPLGGDVPPYHYEPGISVGFAGTAMGVPASGSAHITLVPPNLHADLDVGDIVLGGTRIKATHFLLDVTPTSVLLEASGGIAITGGPDAAAELRVAASLLPLPPTASATFTLDVNNWNLPFPGASVKSLHATANLGVTFGSLPSGSLEVDAELRVGSTPVTATGELTVTNGRLASMNVEGSVGSLVIGGVQFTGPGCDTTGPETGPCISAGFDSAQNPPLSLGVAGSVDVEGYGADLTVSFGPTGLHGSGSLRVPALGNPTVTGDVWFGSSLQGVTARDGQGILRQVQEGDFRFTAQLNNLPAPLNGSSLAIDLGKIGPSEWIKGAGTLVLAGRTLANGNVRLDSTGMSADGSVNVASPVGGAALSIAMAGSVTFDTPSPTTRLGWTLTGSLGAQSTSADPALRVLGQGTFTLSRPPITGQATTFSFAASVSLPGFTGSFTGDVASNGSFCLSGQLTFPGLGVGGTATVGSSGTCVGLRIRVVVGGFTFDGRVFPTGTSLSASFNDVRQLQITPNHGYAIGDSNQVADWLRFTTAVSGSLAWSNAGFSLTSTFAAEGRVVWDVRCAVPRNLSPAGTFCRGAAVGARYVLNFDATLGVRVSGTQLCATVPGLPEYCIPRP